MSVLEQRIVERFRELGDVHLRRYSRWGSSEIAIGDEVGHSCTRVTEGDQSRIRSLFTLTVDGAMRVQAFGRETFLGSVLVDAEVYADRKQDGGPIRLLHGFLDGAASLITTTHLVVSTSDGLTIHRELGCRPHPAVVRKAVQLLRKERRLYEAEMAPFSREGVLRDRGHWIIDTGISGSGHTIRRVGSVACANRDASGGERLRRRHAMRCTWISPEGWYRSVSVFKARDGAMVAGREEALWEYERELDAREAAEATRSPTQAERDDDLALEGVL